MTGLRSDENLNAFQFSTDGEEWYWHTLYFTGFKEAQQAKRFILAQYDECCTINPCSSNEYEVSFFTNYVFDNVFRTHLLTNVGVSPQASLFNEETDDMLDRESSGSNSQPTVLQVVAAFVLTALLLPFAYAFFLFYMPMFLIKHFTREQWFTCGKQGNLRFPTLE